MISVNLFGAPGASKSTTAAFLFHYLKCKNTNIEMVREYAKDIVYEGSFGKFRNQLHVTAEQYKRMKDIASNEKENVQLIVTDCPLVLGKIYAQLNKHHLPSCDTFCKLLDELNTEFENFNVFINRVKKYNPKGRMQTEAESDAIALDIKKLVPWDMEINGDQAGQLLLAETIYEKFKDRISF